MKRGVLDITGAPYVTEVLPVMSFSSGGVATTEMGSMYITSTLLPRVYVNGAGVLDDGRLCVAFGGVIAGYSMGLPFTSDGRLVCQSNITVQVGDTYVGGIRVGVNGIYVNNVTPPQPGTFDSSFDGSFD